MKLFWWKLEKPQPKQARIIITVDGFVTLDCSVEHLTRFAQINPEIFNCRNIRVQVVYA